MREQKNIPLEFIKIFLIIFIPLLLLQFVLYSNLMPADFEYFYDVGSQNDNYLSPEKRVSDTMGDTIINYRELKGGLVYFDIPIVGGTKSIEVSIRFKESFPENAKFFIGAKDQEEWGYKYNPIYDTELDSLNGGDWTIVSTKFDLKEDNLYIEEGKLSMVFRTPHLDKEEYSNYMVPIDWVNIIVHKEGLI